MQIIVRITVSIIDLAFDDPYFVTGLGKAKKKVLSFNLRLLSLFFLFPSSFRFWFCMGILQTATWSASDSPWLLFFFSFFSHFLHISPWL